MEVSWWTVFLTQWLQLGWKKSNVNHLFEYGVASLVCNSFLSAIVYYSESINFTRSSSVDVQFLLCG